MSLPGWFAPYDSVERQDYIKEGILASDAIIFGRKTYEMLYPYWSSIKKHESAGMQQVADKLNSVPKYVVSSRLKKTAWSNSTILSTRIEEQIRNLKEQPGSEMQIEGSATLVRSLMETELIDEYRFLVHPVIGSGERFFADVPNPIRLRFLRAQEVALGVVVLYYGRG